MLSQHNDGEKQCRRSEDDDCNCLPWYAQADHRRFHSTGLLRGAVPSQERLGRLGDFWHSNARCVSIFRTFQCASSKDRTSQKEEMNETEESGILEGLTSFTNIASTKKHGRGKMNMTNKHISASLCDTLSTLSEKVASITYIWVPEME